MSKSQKRFEVRGEVDFRMAQTPFAIRTFNDLEMTIYVWSGEAYARSSGLSYAFSYASESGMRGLLSKLSITTVENEELKSALRLTGKVRWINTAGIKKLLGNRLESDELLLQACSDLESALNGEGRPVTVVDEANAATPPVIQATPADSSGVIDAVDQDSSVGAAANSSDNRPVVVHPRPRPVMNLHLPRESEWYLDDRYVVGKKYALEAFDFGDELKKQLEDYRSFWTDRDFLPNRKGEAWSSATLEKREQRLLLYLGFLAGVIKAVDDPKSLSLNAVLNHHAVSAYIEWCQKARLMANSNIVENVSAFCSVVKFIYRDSPLAANNFADLELLSRFKSMRNRLSSKALNPQKTIADLEAESKWLPFELFIEAIEALQNEFDVAISPECVADSGAAARLLHDLCLLRIYQACPSRSGEIRQLEFVDWETLDELRGRKVLSRYVLESKRNILTRRPLSCFSMHIGSSKTTKHTGVTSTDFQEALFPALDCSLQQYLVDPNYRLELLRRDHQHCFVFTTPGGNQFDGPAFSRYLSSLIQRLTGVKATSNVLRSSFVSMLMGDNPDDSLRASAAKLLNHSLRTQAEVYDRRSATQKKQHAQSFVAKRDREFSAIQSNRRSKTTVIDFSPGMIVCVPFKDSITGDDAFWLAKVMSCDAAELTLIELAPTNTPNEYRANLRSVWREPLTACFLCDVHYDERSNAYTLRTSASEIAGLLKVK